MNKVRAYEGRNKIVHRASLWTNTDKKLSIKQYRKIIKLRKPYKYKDELVGFENLKAHKLTLSRKIIKIRASFGKSDKNSIFDFCSYAQLWL